MYGPRVGRYTPHRIRPDSKEFFLQVKITLAEDIQGDLEFSPSEYERRYEKIRDAMEALGLDCLIITGAQTWYRGDECNLLYVSGVGVRLEPPFVILPLKGQPISYYKESKFAPVVIPETSAPISWEGSPLLPNTGNAANYMPAVIKTIRNLGLANARIGLVCERLFPVDLYRELVREFPHAEFTDAEQLMTDIRRVKSEEEIKFLCRSAYCADMAIQAVVDNVTPGMTDLELILLADSTMAKFGTIPGGFQLLASGKWGDIQGLGQGSSKKVEPGDLVLNELTSNYKGYYTQLAVPISVGAEPALGFRKFMEVNDAMYQAQYRAFRTGTTIREIDNLGNEIGMKMGGAWLSRFACQTVDFEQSFMHPNPALEPGMAFVLMPWIHSDQGHGFVGHGSGNTVVCTEDTGLILHQTPLQTVVVD